MTVAMDRLSGEQKRIENALAARHLKGGSLILYGITSTYLEGRACPPAQLGYSRDGKSDNLQIVTGLLCAPDGCPAAVEVFEDSRPQGPTDPSPPGRAGEGSCLLIEGTSV